MPDKSPRKVLFWWVSIAGADPEPVEETEHEGRPCVYTCGCGDPFYLDDPSSPVRFVGPMKRPEVVNKTEAAAIDKAYHQRRIFTRPHSWRGPR